MSSRQAGLSNARLSALQQRLEEPPPAAAKVPAVDALVPVQRSSEPFPMTRLLDPSHDVEQDIRLPRTMELRAMTQQLEDLQSELKGQGHLGGDLHNGVQHLSGVVQRLEKRMNKDFVPQHSQLQLISPPSFFAGRIFHVKNRALSREPHLKFPLDSRSPNGAFYVGPELRQGDGLVFMALLNLCRDYRVGKQACFDVAAMVEALGGTYNGQRRRRLKDTIQRLQRATIEFPGFTVQLVQRFEHPKFGDWSVSLDRDIVELFRDQRRVWLDLPLRLRLSEGLTTWLYGYICCQTTLIPWSIDDLRERCGSDSNDKAFREMLGQSLRQLAREGIIDSGWSLRGKQLRWRKPPQPEPTSTRKTTKRPKKLAEPQQSSLLADADAFELVLCPQYPRS